MFTSAALAGVYQRIGGIIVKRIKSMLLLSLAALLCFAAMAAATPKSLVITDMDDGTHFNSNQAFSAFAQFWATTNGVMGNPAYSNSPKASLPVTEDIMPFVPANYTGDVSADIYYSGTLSATTDATENMPATSYRLSGPYGAPYFPDALPLINTVLVIGGDGNAESCDVTHTELQGSPVVDFEIKTAKSYPVRVYGLAFQHTPLPKYTITAAAGANGTITPASADVEKGASCDFVITADSGCVIDALTVDGSAVAAAAGVASYTYTLENVTKAVSISATFKKSMLPKYTVTTTAGTGGTITPASADVEKGASCDFVITADSGCVIDALTVDGSAVAAAAGVASYTYTLENVTKAVSISATFKKSIEPGKENVSEIGASGEGVTAAEPVFVEASDKIVASFDAQADNSKELPLVKADGTSDQNVTFKKEAFVCAVKLDVTHTDAAAAMTLAFSPAKDKTFDAAKKYYAMILNKKTGAYAIFECAQANGKLNMTVRPVGDYFSENTVVVYTGTATNAGGDTPSTGGGSGGGCNAGMAALALLALVPLALRRKK